MSFLPALPAARRARRLAAIVGLVTAAGAFAAPAARAAEPLTTYMTHQDAYCRYDFWGFPQYNRAYVYLYGTPRGSDPRTPKSAVVKVTKTGSPSTIYNWFSVGTGVGRRLTVPLGGYWTYTATITFTDGTTFTGSHDVPYHGYTQCEPFSY